MSKVDQPDNNDPVSSSAVTVGVPLMGAANSNEPSRAHRDYLFNAVLYGRQKKVEAFLAQYPDAASWRLRDDITPLSTAIMQGHATLVELLLKAGARVDEPMSNGQTAMITAGSVGNLSILQLLIQNGGDINETRGDGETPLTQAIDSWKWDAARELVRLGANIEAKGWDNATPLLKAAAQGNAACCIALLKAGADIDAKNRKGQDALAVAIQWRDCTTDNQRWIDVIAVLETARAEKTGIERRAEGSAIAESVFQGTDKPITVSSPLRLKDGASKSRFLATG